MKKQHTSTRRVALLLAAVLAWTAASSITIAAPSDSKDGDPKRSTCYCHKFPYILWGEFCSYYAEECGDGYVSIDDACGLGPYLCPCSPGCLELPAPAPAVKTTRHKHYFKAAKPGKGLKPITWLHNKNYEPTHDPNDTKIVADYLIEFKVSDPRKSIFAKVFVTRHTTKALTKIFALHGLQVKEFNPKFLDFTKDEVSKVIRIKPYLFEVTLDDGTDRSYLVVTQAP